MIALRLAAAVAALITITLNAVYGFKTSSVWHYAVLFAALNASLDVAKCACLVAASRAWQDGQHAVAVLLFVLFWPLLANSLWCGLSEVAFNRATATSTYTADQEHRTRATAAYARATADVNLLTAQPLYRSTSACAFPKSTRERTFCTQYATAVATLATSEAALTHRTTADPAPQVTLLASWSGLDLAFLLLATALWPIVLAELCGSVGFYLTSRRDRTDTSWSRFWRTKPNDPPPPPQNPSTTPPVQPLPTSIRWPAISS